jgi:hypothetical protein
LEGSTAPSSLGNLNIRPPVENNAKDQISNFGIEVKAEVEIKTKKEEF